jgi:outer membrane lipoprotein carrier protein
VRRLATITRICLFLFFTVVTTVYGVGLTPALGESQNPADGVLERIEAVYGKAADLSSEFVQKTLVEGFGERISRGTLYLKKPGMARWDYRSPVKQQIFITNDKVLLYQPEQKQAVVQKLSSHPDAEPALGLLSDIGKWRTLYEIHPLPQEPAGSQGDADRLAVLEMIPREKHRIEKVRVTAREGSGDILRLTLFEAGGNRITFEFSNMRLDRGLKNSLFEFKIPKDVEILEVPP